MRFVVLWLACCVGASATTYYISNTGTDAPGCVTAATACRTLGYANALALQAGDSVLLQRGGVWNEQLIPAASGVSGNPITYDAYGTGGAPVLTPVIDLSSATWNHNTGNIYTTTLSTSISSPQIYNVRMGSVWGKRRTANPGCTSAGVIQGYGDFCVVYPTLYVYSPNGTLPSAYYGTVMPVVSQAAGLAIVSVVGKSWLVFQHLKIQNFDYMGVSVTGASDNLVFGNMESDGMVPYGTTPHGFYVKASSGHGANVQFFNDEGLLGGRTGAEKKDAAMVFLENALATVDAVAAREIVNPGKFREGISKIIDGTVECLNASTWAKEAAKPANPSAASN